MAVRLWTPRAGSVGPVLVTEDHGGRTRLGEERVIPRIRDERQVARLRLLDARDTDDVDVARRAFETTAQRFSQITQLHSLNFRI